MKAILVVDMPKDCRECPCFYDWLCCQAKDGLNVVGDKRPRGCPLKPMPQKKETRNAIQYRGLAEEYRKEGFNECIDEILGGEE